MHSASIDEMPTLYVRNVPPCVYSRLKAMAKERGRSLNGQVLEILEQEATRQRGTLVAERLEEIARRIQLPPEAPKAEELIRKGREERDRRS